MTQSDHPGPGGWIADRMHHIDASGIRRIFDLAAGLDQAVDLSIGQPHFSTPEPIRRALAHAVENGHNGYSPSPGIPPLREALQQRIDSQHGHHDRRVMVTSGTSGGLVLALCCLVEPGDEVILFDPGFMMYQHLVTLAGGTAVTVDTYPSFSVDVDRVAAAITDRTKVIVYNSPGNPTGAMDDPATIDALARLAENNNIALISDEIYSRFCYDQPFHSPASTNPATLVIDGFSKSHSMTGWRLGFAHGPEEIIEQMIKLQQFTFVCAPHPVQWAGMAALDVDIAEHVDDYRRKRDRLVERLSGHFEIGGGAGAFYLFLAPSGGNGTEFVHRAIERGLLIVPGSVFSSSDSHIRVSFAVDDPTLEAGADLLIELAQQS